jgi:hypothetical protein
MMTNWRSAERDQGDQGDQAAGGEAGRPRTGAIQTGAIQTGAALRAALEDVPPPDDEFSRHIATAVALLRAEVSDPWGLRADLS